MKFSKSSWISLALGVVVIAAIMVGLIRTQQNQTQKELEKNLSEAQQKLAQIDIDELTTRKNLLIEEKTTSNAQIAEAKFKLTDPIDSIAATDLIIQSAYECGLRIVNISSNGKSNSTLAGNKVSAMPFNLQVQGDISNIADFVTNIKIVFPTSVVDAYQFTMGKQTADPETPDGGIPASSDPTPVVAPPSETLQLDSANINIIIYSYKGDANVE